MPSMFRKLSRHRRHRSTSNNAAGEKKKGDHDRCEPQPQEPQLASLFPGDLPLSIQVDSSPSSLVVSPLKSPPPSQHSHPSLALTESTLSSHPSCNDSTSGSDAQDDDMSSSDDDSTDAFTATANQLGLMIPPRRAQSRWNQDDFLTVIRVWNLSQEEVYKMRELEAQLYNVDHWKNNPFEVVRFMKGPQGYQPAERWFRRMIEWRLANKVDTILDDYTPPRVLLDYCPSAILHGLDKDGDPIYLERAGATDACGLLKRFGHDALMHHVVWLRELCGRGPWIQDHEARMGRPITQVTIVYDLAGLDARHLRPGVLPFFGHMMRLTQDYYTGPVKRMIIIRAPAIFRAVWGIVKHFFDPWAVKKMTFTGTHNYEEVLSQFMDLCVLPPVVSPNHGRGRAAEGMPQRFEGGILPALDHDDNHNDKPVHSLVTPMKTTTRYNNHPVNSNSNFNFNSTPTTSTSEEDEQNNNSGVEISTSLIGSGFFHLDDTSGMVSVEPVVA